VRYDILRMNSTNSTKFRLTDPPRLPAPIHVPRHLFAVDAGPCVALPVAPLLEPERGSDVILVVDVTGPPLEGPLNISRSSHFPAGNFLEESELYASERGLPHPAVPGALNFRDSPELLRNNTFFGCFDEEKPALVYVPHRNETYSSDVNLFIGRTEMSASEQREILMNGRAMMSAEPFQRCLLCLARVKAEQSRGGRTSRRSEKPDGQSAFLEAADRLGGVCQGCIDFCWEHTGKSAGGRRGARNMEELPMVEFITSAMTQVDRSME